MNSQLSKLIQFTLMLFTVFSMNTHLRAATVNPPLMAAISHGMMLRVVISPLRTMVLMWEAQVKIRS